MRRLVTGAGVDYLAWSPDGGRIAFTQGSTLSVITLDDNSIVLDSNAEVTRDGPSWHPTGSTVAYPASGDGFRDAWIAAADGSVPPRRIAQPSDDAGVAYGPDGRLATMGHDGLFVSDDQGGDRRQLGDPNYNYGQVAWSPDGTRLMALPSSQDNHHIVDVASGATTRIGGSDPHQVLSGAWSPTRTHLVIEAYYSEQDIFGTWLASADGSAPTLLAANVGDPRWAGADQIVAVQQGDNKGQVWELITFRPDGSGRRSLLTNGTDGYRSMGQPHVSPDGRTIAFVVYEVNPDR